MRGHTAFFVALLTTSGAQANDIKDVLFGTFSNEEEVYFDQDSGKTPPPWFSLRIGPATSGAMIEEIDAFGIAGSEGHAVQIRKEGARTTLDYGACQRHYAESEEAFVAAGMTGRCAAPATVTRIGPEGITLTYPDGKTSLLRRARPVTCWSAIPKEAKKADGSTDWFFARDVKIHDQGGRAMVGKDQAGVKPVVIRMRNVVWPPGNSNRPSLVLYIHMPEEPDKATSYVWADPGAARIGINLRWMQASCTVDGKETRAD
jgi:hypothetical protein